MKKLIAAFVFFPSILFSQELKNQVNLSGGFEYKNSRTTAWNVQTTFNRQFQKSSRWSAEYGINFYVLEHRRNKDINMSYDSIPVILTYGAIIYPGYTERTFVHYSKTTALRLQAGVNYALIQKNHFTLSAGLNMVNDIVLDYKEHGQRVLLPAAGYGDTLQRSDYHYSVHTKTSTTNNAVSLQLQPHIDCFVPITQRLMLTARFGYYIQLVSELQFVRPQANLGIAYCW